MNDIQIEPQDPTKLLQENRALLRENKSLKVKMNSLSLHAKAIVRHWDEFGPDYGFSEWIDGLREYLEKNSDERPAG